MLSASSPDLPVDPQLLQELPHDLAITRVQMLNDQVASIIRPLVGSRVSEALRWRSRSWANSPDMYAHWRRPAVAAGQELFRERGFDAIFATGFPWTALLVGRDLSASTGRPLVSDFRDPWIGDDVFAPAAQLSSVERRLEASVVSRSAAVVCVSSVMTEQMRAMHPEVSPERFHTIHNGFDRDDIAARTDTRDVASGRFRVVYTGVWKGPYGPQVLYDAITILREKDPTSIANLEVVTAGFAPGAAAAAGLEQYVTELGRVSHQEALGLMSTAGLLFVAAAPGQYQRLALPGKVFEYLATGRPVLATAALDGEVDRLFKSVGGGIVISPDPSQLAQELANACRRGAFNVPPVDLQRLNFYERISLTGRLARLLDGVLSN